MFLVQRQKYKNVQYVTKYGDAIFRSGNKQNLTEVFNQTPRVFPFLESHTSAGASASAWDSMNVKGVWELPNESFYYGKLYQSQTD